MTPLPTVGRRALLLGGVLLTLMSTPRAQANDRDTDDSAQQTTVYARVIVETAPLRTGPGAGFRVVRIAQRGDAFEVRERSTRGYWFHVVLSDGSLAWIDGNVVYNHEVGPPSRGQRFLRAVFAPAPLLDADGELSVQLGTLSGSGFMAVRPTYLLAPTFGFELDLGASVGSSGRLFMGGAGALINVFPSWPIVPFFTVGGGLSYASPNADSFVLEEGQSSHVYAGGGLRFGFKYRLIVRAEGRSHVFFDEDKLISQEEVSVGLTTFF